MFLNESGNIVNNTGNSDEATSVLGLLLVLVPVDDWELLERDTPVEGASLLVELLLELLETALLDLVLLELLQIVGEANLLPDEDAPLGQVVLPPFNGVAVVGREFVVEVVVTLTKSNKSSDGVVTRRVSVVEWLVSEPMGQGVDTEGGLLNEEDTEDTGVDETTEPVSPSNTGDKHGEDQSHEDDGLDVVAVLPDDDWVIVEVRDIGTADSLWVLLHDHPSDVGVEKALADRVWVLVSVGVSVVGPVIS